MASAQLFLYECAEQFIYDGTIRLYEDSFRLMLVDASYTPNVLTHTVKADVTGEVADGGGYVAGGFVLPPFTITRVGGVTTVDMDDFSRVASVSSIPQHRFAVAYALVTRNTRVNPLLFCVLGNMEGLDIPATPNGKEFKIRWNPNGLWDS
jgi:hypothetical protein